MSQVRYTVLIEHDPEEDLYVATVPALSIVSQGNTRQEALDMIREAAEVAIEGLKATGQPVPFGDGQTIGQLELAV